MVILIGIVATADVISASNPYGLPGVVVWYHLKCEVCINGTRGCDSLDRSVALTFDDGPGPYTAQLLDILKEKNVTGV